MGALLPEAEFEIRLAAKLASHFCFWKRFGLRELGGLFEVSLLFVITYGIGTLEFEGRRSE